MNLLSGLLLRRSAVCAAAAAALATLSLQSPSMAGSWTLEGPFLSQASCEEVRLAQPEEYYFTKPCTYHNLPGPLYDGWYFQRLQLP